MSDKVRKKASFPHVFVILLSIMVIAMVATWFVPAGEYSRHMDPKSNRTVIVPDSFQLVQPSPVDPFQMFVAIQKGMTQAGSIVFFIFIVFSSIYVVMSTGAIDATIAWMVRKTRAKPSSANTTFAVLMAVFMLWGSTGTLSYEQMVAFVPIFASLALALGYDPVVGLAVSFVAVGIGFASATVNPFTIGVAQTISELPLFSGLAYRLLILAVMGSISIAWTLRYARIIKADPSKSVVSDIDFGELAFDESKVELRFTHTHKVVLSIFMVSVLIAGFGLIKLGWYINQLAGLFLIMGILVGLADRKSPSKIAEIFVDGMSKGVLSAMVVGVARGILVVLSEGKIVDSIIHGMANLLGQGSAFMSSVGMLLFQTVMNFLIPSGSGQAATTMPIMAPLSDLVGVNRQVAVLAFQFGDGFSNLLWPTGFILIGCILAKVPLNRYFRWFLPLFAMLLVAQIAFLWGAILIGYGPF
ncbi:YfcC family protein [Dethiosulfovibrio salsuginis]|uniref:Uncharacterized membrane protein YfcC, ion transporter superfamily n=1 Tax=Dethiosulfovibrio salsuginis TaxID=561720 RepID=A0A1X7JLK7_9BACT|nr:AbgT family transporter [Dethiosulfovibrio salsuginis]SMG28708.1 Uncharacterized membrane protein YfcC, ion transporter superfamily [Dethiosulfovibrio salsuginis]